MRVRRRRIAASVLCPSPARSLCGLTAAAPPQPHCPLSPADTDGGRRRGCSLGMSSIYRCLLGLVDGGWKIKVVGYCTRTSLLFTHEDVRLQLVRNRF